MLTRNQELQKRYRIIQQLGCGGFGCVYQAVDLKMDSLVAVKESFADQEAYRRAFEREAKMLANLQHPALPKGIDYFEEDDKQFFVMEYMPGHDLAELLKLLGRPFDLVQVLGWADDLLDALVELHSHRPPIVHRDIKPSNIKLTPKGRIILVDFGLAKGAAGMMPTVDPDNYSHSVYGFSPLYAPLEQMRGIGTEPRSDLYSLAATLWSLLTAQAPPDALARVADKEDGLPDPLIPAHELNPEVPAAVADVLHQAMALNRTHRPASAREMRRALEPELRVIKEERRHKEEEGLQRKEADRRRKEAERERREEQERQQREAEAEARRRQAEEEERARAEASQRAIEEVRQREREERERLRREEEEEKQRQLVEDQRRREAEAEAQRKRIEEEERQKRETEEAARKLAAEEAARRAEEERIKEEEQRKKAAEAARRAEEEAKREREARQRQEAEERARKEEEQRRRKAEEQRQRAEDQARREAEEEARRKREAEEAEHQPAPMQAALVDEEITVPGPTQPSSPPADQIRVPTLPVGPPEKLFVKKEVVGSPVGAPHPAPPQPVPRIKNWRAILTFAAVVVVLLLAVGAVAWWLLPKQTSPTPQLPTVGEHNPQEITPQPTARTNKPVTPVPPDGMAYVPGGEFTMGRNSDDLYESPAHRVTVKPFFIDVYEVTCEDYKKFLDDSETKHSAPPDWLNGAYPAGAARKPVTGIDWDDANAYAKWARKRLPTEEEWEFAARGTDGLLYPWGNNWKQGLANTGQPDGGPRDGASGMAEVGTYEGGKSPYGTYDMIGNAWEWTANDFKDYSEKRPSKSGLKTIRGGCWATSNNQATATFRRGYGARGEKDGYSYTGFRLVKEIPDTSDNH